MNRGFTIVELLVSLAIFIVMTSVIVTKFGNFNQSTLLTDTAYDIALVARLAQTYGLSVKGSSQASDASYSYPYGVSFNTGTEASCGGSTANPTTLVLFADSYPVGAPDGVCGANDSSISTYAIIRGASQYSICVGADATDCHLAQNYVSNVNVSFMRPNPEAVICVSTGGTPSCGYAYSEVTIKGNDGSTRTIGMRQNGQISVVKDAACSANMGGACESAANNCNETNTGTYLCNGSCSASPPPNQQTCQ
jgi:prepilin-type N-terminal cleavage/methylation domain-containing protein